MMEIASSVPLPWIAEYLADLCRWHSDEDYCPIEAEFPFDCPFKHNEDGAIMCSAAEKEDWLRAIAMGREGEGAVNDAQ